MKQINKQTNKLNIKNLVCLCNYAKITNLFIKRKKKTSEQKYSQKEITSYNYL